MTRASASAFWLMLTIIVSIGLYSISYRVDNLEQKLQTLNKQIQKEQSNIHILKAEWDFLSNPSRIENASNKYLKLQPTNPSQIKSIRKLSRLFPTHKEVVRKKRRVRKVLAMSNIKKRNRLHKRIAYKKPIKRNSAMLPLSLDISYTFAKSGSIR